VSGLTLCSDRSYDVSSAAAFARSVFSLARTRDEGEEAEALFLALQELVYMGPPAYEGASATQYTHDSGTIIAVHGYSTCDGIGTAMVQIWNELGRAAHKTYVPARGHTIAELRYRDRDGVERWHAFDAHGAWYARKPDGVVASTEDVAGEPGLVPLRGAWARYRMAGCVHTETAPGRQWRAGLSLHPGEKVRLSWDAQGRFYGRPETWTSDYRRGFFADGSLFRRSVGEACFSYRVEFGKADPAGHCSLTGAVLRDGALMNSRGGDPGLVEFDFPSPYLLSGGQIDLAVRIAGEGDRVKISARPDNRGRWVVLADHAAAGRETVKIDLARDGAALRGFYSFGLRVELLGREAGGAALESVSVERRAQLNPRALPGLRPGWNRYLLRAGQTAQGWMPKVTIAWLGRCGEEFESRTPAALPLGFDVFGARQRDAEPALVMRSVEFECVAAPAATEVRRGAEKTEPDTAVAEKTLALAHGGANGSAALRALLADPDGETRYWAIEGLVALGCREAIPEIGRLLRTDASELVRFGAAEALGRLGGEEAVPFLLEALDAKAYAGLKAENRLPFYHLLPVRWVAVRALARTGDPRAVEPLLRELGGARSDYGAVLAEALTALGARKAIPVLCTKIATERRGPGGRAAAEALGALGRLEPEGSPWRGQAIVTLRGALATAEGANRAAVLDALGQLNAREATAEIEAIATAEGNALVRAAAGRALERLRSASPPTGR
jgi:HEAT repeat protein